VIAKALLDLQSFKMVSSIVEFDVICNFDKTDSCFQSNNCFEGKPLCYTALTKVLGVSRCLISSVAETPKARAPPMANRKPRLGRHKKHVLPFITYFFASFFRNAFNLNIIIQVTRVEQVHFC
jgi:hypothetical protein